MEEARSGSTSSDAGKAVTFAPSVSNDVLQAHGATMDSFFGAPQGPAGTYTADQLAAMGDGGKRLVAVRGLITRVMRGADEDGNRNSRVLIWGSSRTCGNS